MKLDDSVEEEQVFDLTREEVSVGERMERECAESNEESESKEERLEVLLGKGNKGEMDMEHTDQGGGVIEIEDSHQTDSF